MIGCLIRYFGSGFKRSATQSFIERKKIIIRLPQVNIAHPQCPVLFFELDIDLVKIAEFRRCAIGLDGYIIICNRSSDLNGIREVATNLQVQIRSNHRVLRITERDGPAETSIVSDIAKIEEVLLVVF